MSNLAPSVIRQPSVNLLPEQSEAVLPLPDPSYPTGRHAAALAAFLGEIIAGAKARAAAREEEAA